MSAPLIVLCGLTLGCSPDNAAPEVPAPNSSTPAATAQIRQTDQAGLPLPFITEHPDRWSRLNNGSTYEPCTALTSDELSILGIDPTSVSDAAIANFQTVRGCQWTLAGSVTSVVYQEVGNAPLLPVYKEQNADILDWQPDQLVNERAIAVGVRRGRTSCTTHVQSGSAIVTTSVDIPVNPPPISEICARAIAFTRATIDKMPR